MKHSKETELTVLKNIIREEIFRSVPDHYFRELTEDFVRRMLKCKDKISSFRLLLDDYLDEIKTAMWKYILTDKSNANVEQNIVLNGLRNALDDIRSTLNKIFRDLEDDADERTLRRQILEEILIKLEIYVRNA